MAGCVKGSSRLIIGLTGGIASGKSTAAKLLGTFGAHVIDADKLGHRAYLQGTEAFDQVVATFGADVIGEDGEIDRAALGSKVFGAGNRLDELTAIVWPAIRRMAEEEIATTQADDKNRCIVLEAAVLLEAGWQDIADEVWVTVVDREVAIERASARDGSDRGAVQARIDAQLSNEERTAAANRVIDNSKDEAHLTTQLEQLWQEIRSE
ncbi:MAG: dephospho-CoA kinase [Pseudomonadales bacterium]|nr:dephospho-CoA kinase [Pseudomonadales bacterium]